MGMQSEAVLPRTGHPRPTGKLAVPPPGPPPGRHGRGRGGNHLALAKGKGWECNPRRFSPELAIRDRPENSPDPSRTQAWGRQGMGRARGKNAWDRKGWAVEVSSHTPGRRILASLDITLASLWHHFGITVASLWHHFGITVASL